MRTFIPLFVTIQVFLLATACSQTKQGSIELSFSANAGSTTSKFETTSESNSSTSESSQAFFSLAMRPGIFLANGLELEPEFLWTAIEGREPALSLVGNLAYNFGIPRSRVIPFILAGYGAANGLPRFERMIGKSTNDLDISLWDIGTGVKFMISRQAALRVEYRFQQFAYEMSQEVFTAQVTEKYTWDVHNVFLGFSVFLN